MGPLLVLLIIVLLFAGIGFAVHLLWIVAVIALIVWLVGFIARGTTGARWYRW